jgi:hypothetical protein
MKGGSLSSMKKLIIGAVALAVAATVTVLIVRSKNV